MKPDRDVTETREASHPLEFLPEHAPYVGIEQANGLLEIINAPAPKHLLEVTGSRRGVYPEEGLLRDSMAQSHGDIKGGYYALTIGLIEERDEVLKRGEKFKQSFAAHTNFTDEAVAIEAMVGQLEQIQNAKIAAQMTPEALAGLEDRLNDHIRTTDKPYYFSVESNPLDGVKRPLYSHRPVGHRVAPIDSVGFNEDGTVVLNLKTSDGRVGTVSDASTIDRYMTATLFRDPGVPEDIRDRFKLLYNR